MNNTGKGYFKKGNTYGKGGPRPGAGRILQPEAKALQRMQRYLEITLLADFKLMARLAFRPEEFSEKVQFVGTEQITKDKDGNSVKVRSGYKLHPLFEAQLDLLKFRLKKFISDPPQEEDLEVQQNIWTMLKHVKTITTPTNFSEKQLPTV